MCPVSHRRTLAVLLYINNPNGVIIFYRMRSWPFKYCILRMLSTFDVKLPWFNNNIIITGKAL